MRWKKVEYPFFYNEDKREWMKNAFKNFNKFIRNAEITKMDKFNFGYNIEKLFQGENPKYNPKSLDNCVTPDHTKNIYYSPGREIYIVGFPYDVKDIDIASFQHFCNKYNTCCTIFPERYSFYHNEGTVMVIFAHKRELEKLISRYGLDKDRLYFLEPSINFYEYIVENFIDINGPIGDLARDIKNDRNMIEDKNNDKEIFDHIYYYSHGDLEVEKTLKKAQKLYSDYKRCKCV